MADRKLIILGCGGFVGSHLTERLLSDGRFEVLGYDRVIESKLGVMDANAIVLCRDQTKQKPVTANQ